MSKKLNYVLIIGSSNMDLNIYSERFPNPGETVTGGIFKQYLGGKGANQAVAAVRSGANTIFIGKVGMDSFGNQMVSQLAGEGIDVSHIIRDSEEKSGVAFILIDNKGENMISVAPGANFKLSVEEIKTRADIIKKASSLVVQMEIPMETIEEIFKIASQGDVIKILNPAPLKPIPLKVLEHVDIIIPNEGELYRLYSFLNQSELTGDGKLKILQASRNIAKLGIKYVITTLGNKGSLIYLGAEDKSIEIGTPKVNAIDTVGAGDCFIGVLASKLSQGESIRLGVGISLKREIIFSERSTSLRKNNSKKLVIHPNSLEDIFTINGSSFKTKAIKENDLIIKPYDIYMIINKGKGPIELNYSNDILNHQIIYNPYSYENSDKINFKAEQFIEKYKVPKNYIDTLPKWYSFKFTYPDYNLIFVRPEFGLSIQIHKDRNEYWEILDGKPIIINGNKVYYYVENRTKFQNKINTYHSVINPNKEIDKYIIIKERWDGKFDENDIKRIFNPNQYF
jgi:ribokinase